MQKKTIYQSGIPNIDVLLLKKEEEIHHAKHMRTEEMMEEVLLESELRGA